MTPKEAKHPPLHHPKLEVRPPISVGKINANDPQRGETPSPASPLQVNCTLNTRVKMKISVSEFLSKNHCHVSKRIYKEKI
jgi:hypothetical protein